MKRILHDEEQTLAFGASLFTVIDDGCLVFLSGDLGAGKTTLVRGFLRAGGHIGPVKSPTFTVVEEYLINNRLIFHLDLYRLGDPEELEYLGIRDYLDNSAICFIEWPEKGKGFLPQADLNIILDFKDDGRTIVIASHDKHGDTIRKKLERIIIGEEIEKSELCPKNE